MDAGNGTIHRNPRNRKRSIIRNRPGPTRPLSPRQDHWPWTHFAMKKTSYTKVFPHGTQGKNEYLSTGAMKTLKKVGREIQFSLRPFFMSSPDASASGRRWNTASPWCQRYSRLVKMPFFSAIGLLRVTDNNRKLFENISNQLFVLVASFPNNLYTLFPLRKVPKTAIMKQMR